MNAFGLVASAVTAAVAAALAGELTRQFRARRRPYALWWSISFVFMALAALLQAVAYAHGSWPALLYRAYLALSAGIPGFMGAGTVYLFSRKAGHGFLGLMVALELLAVAGAAATPLRGRALTQVFLAAASVPRVAPGVALAVAFAALGGLGGLALVLGAIYSYVRSRHAYNLLIALGGLVFSAADTSAATWGPALFFPGQLVGALLLFWGVVKAREVHRARARTGGEGAS